MVQDNNFIFKTSISIEAYANKEISGAMIGTSKDANNREIRKKYGYQSNKGIGYRETEVTAQQLLDYMINGHVMCNLFNPQTTRKDGTFGSSQKKDANFKGSFTVGVDIDNTKFKTAEEFIETLSLKPSLYYTSYSNLQEDKGARFRMVYIFDELITNPYFFRYVAWNINKSIEADTNEVIDDYCNVRCSQYFNGTNIKTDGLKVSYGITNNIFNLSDFGLSDFGFCDFLKNYCYYKSKNRTRTAEINKLLSLFQVDNTTYYNDLQKDQTVLEEAIETEKPLIDATLLNDMGRLSFDEVMKYNRHKYHYFYRAEKDEWINNTFQFVNNDYFAFTYSYGKNKIQYDGQHRRKKVFMRMCLRRVMCPNVDANTIMFNAYVDIHKFFDWSGLSIEDYLKRNVENCFNMSIEDIENLYSDVIADLRSKTKPKRGIIYKNRKAHTKEVNYFILDELYQTSLSVKENLEVINEDYGYKISKTIIYEYLKNRGIKTNKERLSDEQLRMLTDVSKTYIENYNNIKSKGYKVGDKRYRSIYKEYANSIINVSSNTTYYNKTEKDQIRTDELTNSENSADVTADTLTKNINWLYTTLNRTNNNNSLERMALNALPNENNNNWLVF